jgi:hypothetical protein
LHDVVQLAGGKLLLYSHGADDRVRSWRRDLKRDIEYSLRNGLHFEPTRVSDELLSTILTNWKIKRAASSTIGRIAHEVPIGRGSFGEAGRFMSPDAASKFFQGE